MLIFSNIELWAKARPEKKCLIHSHTELTYGELQREIDRIAHCVAAVVKKGGKIIVRLSNPVKQLVFILGASKAGAASIPIDISMPGEYVSNLAVSISPVLIIDDGHPLNCEKIAPLPVVTDDDLFLGSLSSGSTGPPKLVWRDHGSWVKAFPFQSRTFMLGSSDRLFLSGSMAYTANLNSCLHLLHEGGTVIFAGSKQPRSWVKEIIFYNISSIFMVPAHYRILLKSAENPLPHVKSLVSAGSKLDISTVKSLISFFPNANICEYYGASELGYVSVAGAGDLLKFPESVGKAFPGVKLWTENDFIWVESPYLAPDYRPRATIGDLGKIDDERYLFLLGRKNNVINSGGLKIMPEQVEDMLNRCPGIAASAVKGVDDPLKGQKVAAWVVKNDSSLTVRAIKSYCKKLLPKHCCPRHIFFIEELPLNINGKIDRSMLRNN